MRKDCVEQMWLDALYGPAFVRTIFKEYKITAF